MDGVIDAYGERKSQEVLEQTWGHLAPGEKTYGGYILYTVGCFGDIVCIQTHFRELPDSPWFYADLHEYMGCNKEDAETGVVYLFLGSYCHTQPDKFIGVITRMTGGMVRDKIEKGKNGS